MNRRAVAALCRGLLVGACGGKVFSLFGLPLPWVLGAMVATIVAGAVGHPAHMPRAVRNSVIPALGVTFGSAFDSEALVYLEDLWLLVPMTFAYLAAIICCGCFYFTRYAAMDLRTAYFASVPGSFSEMIFVAEDLNADIGSVAIVNAIRQVVGLSLITLGFRYGLGIDTARTAAIGAGTMTPGDVATFLFCGVVGFFGGRALRLPSAHLFGPLILSAAAHLAGVVDVAPPGWLVALVQIFVGIFIGLRFADLRLSAILPVIRLAAVWALILLGFASLAAGTAVRLLDLPFEAAFLAFAPGGAAEISVVALAAGVSLSIVTTIQLIRISLTVLLVPLVIRLVHRKRFWN